MGRLTRPTISEDTKAPPSVLPERRVHPRYPLQQHLILQRLNPETEHLAVPGKTLNMSSGGILLEADAGLMPGDVLQIAISWPAKLDESCALKLVVTGKVIRCSESQVAVKILQHSFKTVGTRGLSV